MSIKNKLITGFTISIIVTVLACIIIFSQLKTIDSDYRGTFETSLPQTYSTAELNRLVMTQATLVQNYLLGKDTLKPIQESRDEVNNLISDLNQRLDTNNKTSLALIESIKEKANVMHAGFDEAIKLKDTEGLEVASKYYIDVAGMNVITFMDDSTALFTEISKSFEESQNAAAKKTDHSLTVTTISIILAVITGIIATFSLTKRIAKPMHQLERHVQEITNGNLTVEPLAIQSNDEIGHLSEAINNMRETLYTLLNNLSDNSSHLSSTSEQLVASAEEVNVAANIMLEGAKGGAESSKAMAHTASESATAMDETATAVQRIAESSQQLTAFASQTEEIAKIGTTNIHTASIQMASIFESTKLTTELIQKLSKQSEEIESITQVITGITDQTNLLALNAAIEAARAGEHGKGFAVVADEVRKLAEESNRSASQITTLTNEIQRDTKNVETAIQESLQNVEQGVEIIDSAGNSFEQIVSAISNMRAQIEEVSAVSEQISAAAEEVSASVSEIARSAEMTNQNALYSYKSSEQQVSTVQEVLSVANDLGNRAQELQKVVSSYRL